MKVFIVATLIMALFEGGIIDTKYVAFKSPEEAAVFCWSDSKIRPIYSVPVGRSYRLYEIDLDVRTVRAIEFPDMVFDGQVSPPEPIDPGPTPPTTTSTTTTSTTTTTLKSPFPWVTK